VPQVRPNLRDGPWRARWACTDALRKGCKGRRAFPHDASILTVGYLGLQPVAAKWPQPMPAWKAALKQLVMLFGARVQV